MPEPTNSVETKVNDTAPAPAPAPETFEMAKYINNDGTMKEGWKDALVPEDLRHLKCFDSFLDLKGAFKNFGHAELTLKRQGKGVFVPGKDATPTEREAFYKALGRPDKPEDYKVDIPKGLEDYYDDPLINEARLELHKAGLTQEQVEVVMALDRKRIEIGKSQLETEELRESEDAEQLIRQESGDAYESRLHVANLAIDKATAGWPAEKKAQLFDKENGLLNQPRYAALKPFFFDFLADLGKKFIEHKIVSEPETSGAMTPSEAEKKMNELIADRASDAGMKWNNPAKYERLNKEIDELAKVAIVKKD